jgi:hypothetical protein
VSIRYHPAEFLARAAPERVIEKLVTERLTVSRAAVSMLTRSGLLSRSRLETIALRVAKTYREKLREGLAEGLSRPEALSDATNENRLLVQRVQNAMVREIARDIKATYRGEFFVWLPSDAVTPNPLHQLNYGRRFQIGRGEMPGDDYGCQCGMRILVAQTELFEEDAKIAA